MPSMLYGACFEKPSSRFSISTLIAKCSHMDALEILKVEHGKITALFEQMRKTGDSTERRDLYAQAREAIVAHNQLEAVILYPALAKQNAFQVLLEAAHSEHDEIRSLLSKLDVATDTEETIDLSESLMTVFESHVREEESELYYQVRRSLEGRTLVVLGDRMIALLEGHSKGSAAA